MKNLFIKFFAIAIVSLLVACDPAPFDDVPSADSYGYVGFTNSSGTLSEGNGASASTRSIGVYRGGSVTESEVVSIAFTGGAVYGVDFNITGAAVSEVTTSGMTVTIPADERIVKFNFVTKPNVAPGADRTSTLTISDASSGAHVGFPQVSVVAIKVAEDDCAFDLETDFSGPSQVTEVYGGDPDDDWGPYDPEVTFNSGNVLDIANIWDSGWPGTITLDPVDNSLVIAGGPYSLAGSTDWVVSGSGFLSPCTDEIKLTVDIVSSYNGGYETQFVYNIKMTPPAP